MSAAQLEISGVDPVAQALPGVAGEGHKPGALRQQMAERVAQHRQRRGRHGHAAATLLEDSKPEGRRRVAASVASAVAERYAQSPSYRAFLADEAQKAIRQAAAAAEVAVRNAEAVASAQQGLLAELELWTAPQAFTAAGAVVVADPVAVKPAGSGRITVKLYEDLEHAPIPSVPMKACVPTVKPEVLSAVDVDEYEALDEEIAFRQAPVFDDFRDFSAPVEPIAANLLEFPRQLVATKKVRPRLAEGPLREEAEARGPQLRIFEVEAGQMSAAAPVPSMQEWLSIHLDAHTAVAAVTRGDMAVVPEAVPLYTAAVSQRMMAAAVDMTLVSATFLAFAAMAAYVAGTVPVGLPAVTTAAVLFAVLYVCYQLIFFTFSDQTPGMRYARIGLCTFSDDNPTRSAMRRRIFAMLIAACPFGMGLLWVWLDDETLGWHDRLSRMYQRSY